MQRSTTLNQALWRGLFRKCPQCAKASAFSGYLKVRDRCPACEEPLSIYPCDDGPAYVTILLVGHIVVAPLFMFPFFWDTPVALLAPALMISIGLLTVVILPFIKGMFLNLLWHHKLRNAGR